MAKGIWVYSPAGRKGGKINEFEKKRISDFFQSLIDEFKAKIKPPENKDYNHIIDIYSKWYQNCFIIYEKWKVGGENRIKDEFESKVVRLKYIDKDKFDFSYFRHTNNWFLVETDLTLQQCKEMILGDPNFQPMVF